MGVDTAIIGIDLPKQVIVIGNLTKTDKGIDITNQSQYRAFPKVIPYALQALGSNAKIAIDCNIITAIKPEKKGEWYRSQTRSCSVTGMMLYKIDGLKNEIIFKPDPQSKIFCKAILHTRAQVEALEFLGKPCTFYLSTRTYSGDNYKKVIAVTNRQF